MFNILEKDLKDNKYYEALKHGIFTFEEYENIQTYLNIIYFQIIDKNNEIINNTITKSLIFEKDHEIDISSLYGTDIELVDDDMDSIIREFSQIIIDQSNLSINTYKDDIVKTFDVYVNPCSNSFEIYFTLYTK